MGSELKIWSYQLIMFKSMKIYKYECFLLIISRTLDGKPYKAYVKEKQEAKNIYNQAVAQGIGAAHVAAKCVSTTNIKFP